MLLRELSAVCTVQSTLSRRSEGRKPPKSKLRNVSKHFEIPRLPHFNSESFGNNSRQSFLVTVNLQWVSHSPLSSSLWIQHSFPHRTVRQHREFLQKDNHNEGRSSRMWMFPSIQYEEWRRANVYSQIRRDDPKR